MKIGFDNDKYLRVQPKHIRECIFKFSDKPYFGFGGKLFDGYRAFRVLSGFQSDGELRMLLQLADQAEIITAISAVDIKRSKIRGSLGITYDVGILCLIQAFRDAGLYVGPVVITRYTNAIDRFKSKFEAASIKVYRYYLIDGYPANMPLIISEDGYGKNEYIGTMRPLVITTASGPDNGKVATCLSQLYYEDRHGMKAGYAKFGTFPIWDLPLNHPVNLAYEAATADLNDVNMIDPFHLEAYSKMTTSYDRGAEIFPMFSAILEGIYGSCLYKSPTDTGASMVGNCIADDGVRREAGRQEITRCWYTTVGCLMEGESRKSEATEIEFLVKQVGVTTANRPVVHAALLKAGVTGVPAAAIELSDGRIVTGKTSESLGTGAAVLLSAVETLGDIPDETKPIFPAVTESVQMSKINYLGFKNPRLHADEIPIALLMSVMSDPNAAKALGQLKKLRGCQAHTSVILSEADIRTPDKFGLRFTSEPRYENGKIYH